MNRIYLNLSKGFSGNYQYSELEIIFGFFSKNSLSAWSIYQSKNRYKSCSIMEKQRIKFEKFKIKNLEANCNKLLKNNIN